MPSVRSLKNGYTNEFLWKIINRDHLGRTDGQVAGAELAGLLAEENRVVIKMLMHGNPVMLIIPPRIDAGMGKRPALLIMGMQCKGHFRFFIVYRSQENMDSNAPQSLREYEEYRE